jgi:hypothetical protein
MDNFWVVNKMIQDAVDYEPRDYTYHAYTQSDAGSYLGIAILLIAVIYIVAMALDKDE